MESQPQQLKMAYMDVASSGTYWGGKAAALRDAGYRVVIRTSKPSRASSHR